MIRNFEEENPDLLKEDTDDNDDTKTPTKSLSALT